MDRPRGRRRLIVLLTLALAGAAGVAFDVPTRAVDAAWQFGEWAARPFVAGSEEAQYRRNAALRHESQHKSWGRIAAKCSAGEWSVRAVPAAKVGRAWSECFAGSDPIYEVEDRPGPGPTPVDRDRAAALCLGRADFHREMGHKWRRASYWPWARVTPDPPGPPIFYEPGPVDGSY